MALNLGAFAFHAVASRLLGVAHYGTLYALISLITVLLLPSALLAPVVSRFAAEHTVLRDARHLRGVIGDLLCLCAIVAVAYVAVTWLFAGIVARGLSVPVWGLPLVGLIAAGGFASGMLRSVCQGVQDFRAYAWSTAAEGVARIVALLGLGALGLRLLGGVLGFFVGMLCGLAASAWPLANRFRGVVSVRVRYDWPRIVASSAGVAAMIVATTCFGSVDVLLVKRFFSPADAGLYAGAALGGKVVFYFVSFIPAVMLPRLTERYTRGARTGTAFSEGLVLMLALVVVILIALWPTRQVLLRVLVGGAFDAASPLLLPYAGAMALLAITNLFGSYGIATHRLGFVMPLIAGTLSTLMAIGFVHGSLQTVTLVLLAGSAVTCAAVALVFVRS